MQIQIWIQNASQQPYFTDDVASRAGKNNRVEEPENALTHETRNVTSKTLSAGGVGFGTMTDCFWLRGPAETSIHKHGGG